MKTKLKNVALLAITALLLYLVIRRVGLEELLQTLGQADWRWVAISLLVTPLLALVGVIKWLILLRAKGISVPLRRLFALYLVGRFFNYFLPSNVGGDVVRAYELGAYTRQGAEALASVFVERFTGFVILVLFAVASLVSHLELLQGTGLVPVVILAVLILAAVLWLVLDARPLNLVTRWIRFPFAQKYILKLHKIHTSINTYQHERSALLASLFWSVVFMLLAIANVYTSALAFSRPVSLVDVAVVVPIILVVAMFPITINGIGLQEWAYVLMFTWLGMPASLGLSTILLIRAKDILLALCGGIIYPLLKIGPRQASLAEAEAGPVK